MRVKTQRQPTRLALPALGPARLGAKGASMTEEKDRKPQSAPAPSLSRRPNTPRGSDPETGKGKGSRKSGVQGWEMGVLSRKNMACA